MINPTCIKSLVDYELKQTTHCEGSWRLLHSLSANVICDDIIIETKHFTMHENSQ